MLFRSLALSGSGSLASTNIFIDSGATLDVSAVAFTGAGQTLNGNGVIAGNVTTVSSSVIAPGNGGAGALTFTNNLNMSAGGNVTLELTTVFNSGNDQVFVGGNLTLSSSGSIHISALGGAAPLDQTADYVLFAVTGTTTMTTTPALVWDGTPPSNSGNFSLKKSGNNVVLRYSAGTPPTVTATISPDPSMRNQTVTITANVTQGTASIASVKVDLTALGGSSTASLVQDSSALPSLVYTNTYTVAASAAVGNPALTVTVTDTTTPTALNGIYALSITVTASSLTWDGGSSLNDNWSSGTNWAGDVAPGLVGDSLTFAGTTRLTPNLDTTYSVTGLTFDGTAGAFVLGTAGSTLTNGSSGIVNNSTAAQTFNVPLVMNGAQTFNAAAGSLILNSNILNGGSVLTMDGTTNTLLAGAINGGGGLTKIGTGTLTLTASNGFTGNLFAKAGTVLLDSGKINTGGNYCSIGLNSGDNATFTLKNNAVFANSSGDFNVGDIGDSIGTLNIQDNASLTVGQFFIASANAAGSTASGTVNQTGGTVTENNGGIGTFLIGGRTSASGVGVYNISGGTLTATAGIRVGSFGIGTLNVSGTAVVNAIGGLNVARLAGSTGTVNLDGGTLITQNITSSTGVNCTNNFNGATVRPTLANNWVVGLTQCNVRNGGAILDTTNLNVTISQPLAHSVITGDNATDGGVTKLGASKLTLTGTNTYTGNTTISNGTLQVDGSIASATTVKFGAALGGSGTISGTVANQTGGTLNPGNGIGLLTITGNLVLNSGSTNTFELNGSTPTNDAIILGANVTYGGVLNLVTNGTFTVGQQFQLFGGGGATNTGNFASLVGNPGGGNVFTFTNGILSVVSGVNTTPTNIVTSVSGTTLTLSWPADHTGWRLQAQTNSLNTGLTGTWFDVAGSATVNSVAVPLNPANGAVFYRMVYP